MPGSNEASPALRELLARARRVADEECMELPTSFYRFAVVECQHCRREILVFVWPRPEEAGGEPLSFPRPRTLRLIPSPGGRGGYWGNSCPYCKRNQDRRYLFRWPGAPLPQLHVGGDSPEEFLADMESIAALGAGKGA